MCRMQSRFAISAGLLVATHAAVLGWNAAAPRMAHASCVAPTPKVIWSYPAAGQVDVPLDSDLLVLTEGVWDDAEVTLEGEPLSAGSALAGHFDLGALEPNTTYTVAINASEVGGQPAVDLSWQFTTGDAPADEDVPLAVTIQSATTEVYEWDDDMPCSPAMLADTCFDTGYPSLESFETDIEAGLWVIEVVTPNGSVVSYRLYPGECGQPRMLDYAQFTPGNQYRVHAILRDGSIVSSEPVSVPFGAPAVDEGPTAGAAGSGAGQDDEPAPSRPSGPSMGEGEDAPRAARSCAVSVVGRGRGGFALPLLAAAAWMSTRRRFTAKRSR